MRAAIVQFRVQIALAFAVLFSLPMSLILLAPLASDDCDVQAYLTAASLVRQHRSPDIYNVPLGGGTLRSLYADPRSPFHAAGDAIGAHGVLLYLYPPLLADLLVPLTWLSLRHACNAWLAINLVALGGVAALLAWGFRRELEVRRGENRFLVSALFLLVVAFRPVLIGLLVGQITAILLLLWTAGIVLFLKQRPRASAMVLALAAAIKLTPLIVVVPFLLWRDWRWLRWFSATLLAAVLAQCAVNRPATMAQFLLHVLPFLSHGVAMLGVASFAVSAELLYLGAHGLGLENGIVAVPAWLQTVCGLATSLLAGALLLKLSWLGSAAIRWDRTRVLAAVALLSAVAAPVAWRHAYCVSLILLIMLWMEALRDDRISNASLALLTFSTIELGFVLDEAVIRRMPGPAIAWVQFLPALCAIALVFQTVRQLPFHSPVPRSVPAQKLTDSTDSAEATESSRRGHSQTA